MIQTFGNEIQIPIPCPKCFGRLVCIRYNPSLKLLRDRSWQLCRTCGFQRSTDQFKEELLTV